MRAVLLAAGDGGRYRAAGGRGPAAPKLLLELGGVSLIGRHLECLGLLGIGPGSVTVVAGFMHERVRDVLPGACRVAVNPDWAGTETLASALTGLEAAGGAGEDTVIIHGDLLWDTWLLRSSMDTPGDIVVPFDGDRSPDAEAMKVCLEAPGSDRLARLTKLVPAASCAGESMGMFLLRRRGLRAVLREGPPMLSSAPRASLDDLVSSLAGSGAGPRVTAVDVGGSLWEEIDRPEDLRRAERLLGQETGTASSSGESGWEDVWLGRLAEESRRAGSGASPLLSRIGRRMAVRGDLERLVLEEMGSLLKRAGSEGAPVLEAGCGSGEIMRLAESRHGITCVGADVSPGAAHLCRLAGRSVVRADARRLPFGSDSFRVSYASGMLDQLSDRGLEMAVGELDRVTRPDGAVLMVNAHLRCRLHERIRRRVQRRGRWEYGRKRGLASLKPLLERVTGVPQGAIHETGRGLLLQLHFVAYLLNGRPALKRLWHGFSLTLNRLLWPLNRFGRAVLVTKIRPGDRVRGGREPERGQHVAP